MIAQHEAVAMLETAEASRKHSTEIYRYSRLSPYLYIWGGVWAAAYSVIAVKPAWFDPVYPLAFLGAIAGSVILSAVQSEERQRLGWRVFASFFLVWAFSVAHFSILAPDNRAIAAHFPLMFGAISAGVGLWIGKRHIAIGVLLAAATLFGYHRLGDNFYAWMAICAGGSLLLTGYWLRRA